MGLFLYVVGSASPTEASVNEQVLHCEGVNNKSYVCETGHCCGESRCCSHYYELWWFWLVWAIIFILSCCCVCHHRRTKHRLQQQQRQHEINLIAYREVHNYSLPFYFRFLPNYLLPDYEEVVHRPATPPPPYSALHTGPPACSSPTDQQEGHCPPRPDQTTPLPPVSDMLRSRTSLEEIHTSSGYHQKDDSKDQLELEQSRSAQSSVPLDQPSSVDKQGECRKEHLRNLALPDEKERIMGRHRRFTGDSGIEVCVCEQGSDSCEPKEFEGLLSEEDQENSPKEFCEECDHHSYREEEQGLLSHESRTEQGALPLPQPHPVSLNLHTINEQEGPYQSNTESQT